MIRERTSHIQRLQKTLEEANIKLNSVISDVIGASGRAMTFVAACNDDNDFQMNEKFWQSIPKCNGTQKAQAAASGQALNYLAASGHVP